MQDLVGESLGDRYLLVTRIAGSGASEVYAGRDLLLDRDVAVKVLRSPAGTHPALVHRFRAEARIIAALDHPNVVRVFDWGEDDGGTYYMVMEHVDGGDLRDVLVGRGPLEPAQAAGIVSSVCRALDAAHAAGLVHGDIKPENVLIARTGSVKVVDFGISSVAAGERGPASAFSGSLRYVAPEQMGGAPPTVASDIWAAGALLAELLTGRRPSPGAESSPRGRHRVWLSSTIPADLEEVLVRACAADPGARYAAAGEMAYALMRAEARSLPSAPPVPALLDEVTQEIDLRPLEQRPRRTRADGRRKRRARRRAAALAVAGFLVASLALGALQAVPLSAAGAVAVAPDVVGLDAGEAADAADIVGLRADVIRRVPSPLVPRGHVISQHPAPNELTRDDTMTLIVSAGDPPASLGGVVGSRMEDAVVRLRIAGLRVGTVTKVPSTAPAGQVLARSPEDDAPPPGTRIDLVVSGGPASTVVPAVEGISAARATSVLRGKGLAVVTARSWSNAVPRGRVISVDATAGERLPQGHVIRLVVSRGPRHEKITLPDLDGATVPAARRRLASEGLTVRVEPSCHDGRRVVDSNPLPGTVVAEGAEVTLFTC